MKKIFIIHILLAMPLLAWCDNITFADAEVKAICVKLAAIVWQVSPFQIR